MAFSNIAHSMIPSGGVNLHVASVGKGPLVLFVHGWPELWLSWRHQLSAVAEAGFQAAAIDVRGYGQSDKPYEIDQYMMAKLSDDIANVIEALGYEQAILVGHDWGAPMVWQTALRHSKKVKAVVGMSVPHFPRAEIPPMELWKMIFTKQGKFFYQVYFEEEGVAEKEFEADFKTTLSHVYYWASGVGIKHMEKIRTGALPTPDGFIDPALKPADSTMTKGNPPVPSLDHMMSESELSTFVKNFEAGGFRGPLGRYRAQNLDWHATSHLTKSDQIIHQPSLFIAGTLDPVLSFMGDGGAKSLEHPLLANLTDSILIPEKGHWIQQEAPLEVNQALLNFIQQI